MKRPKRARKRKPETRTGAYRAVVTLSMTEYGISRGDVTRCPRARRAAFQRPQSSGGWVSFRLRDLPFSRRAVPAGSCNITVSCINTTPFLSRC